MDGRDEQLERPETTIFTVDKVPAALNHVERLRAAGGTNINSALLKALKETEITPKNLIPLIVFLTDGEPTQGTTTNINDIIHNVKKANTRNIPIFSLAFGDNADFTFLNKISLQNFGFARKIYESADASLQLEKFYQEISVPLLSDIQITYLNDTIIDKGSVNIIQNVNFFNGSEIVIVGRLANPCVQPRELEVWVTATSSEGESAYEKKIAPLPGSCIIIPDNSTCIYPEKPVKGVYSNFLERLWAYKTIKNSFDAILALASNQTEEQTKLEKKIVQLALKVSKLYFRLFYNIKI